MHKLWLFFFRSLALSIFLIFPASAVTHGHFFAGQQNAMINIATIASDGSTDSDAADLYALMNVLPQDSFIGPGKSIAWKNKAVTINCGTRPGQGPFCSIVLHEAPEVRIEPQLKKMSFKLAGDIAQEFSKLWNLKAGKLLYLTTDHKMKILFDEKKFLLEFSEEGS